MGYILAVLAALVFILPLRSVSAFALGKTVYPGGFNIAIELNIGGAVIDEVSSVKTAAGNASLGNKLRRGDTITEIDGEKVNCCDEIVEKVEGGEGKEITLTVLREGRENKILVTPYIERDSGLYKLGVYIRDTITGIGTVTYIKENGFFGALGHKIIDSVGGEVPISGGKVYDCEVLGVTRSKRNEPGEIRATMKGDPIGEVYNNTDYGMYGRFYSFKPKTAPVPLGDKSYAVPGKAYILTCVNGSVGAYEVEIIKSMWQSDASSKSLIIRVTDKRLLEITGGIVQGMSGSPILVGGRIVASITHVMLFDPTKGYAIYTDWMQSGGGIYEKN